MRVRGCRLHNGAERGLCVTRPRQRSSKGGPSGRSLQCGAAEAWTRRRFSPPETSAHAAGRRPGFETGPRTPKPAPARNTLSWPVLPPPRSTRGTRATPWLDSLQGPSCRRTSRSTFSSGRRDHQISELDTLPLKQCRRATPRDSKTIKAQEIFLVALFLSPGIFTACSRTSVRTSERSRGSRCKNLTFIFYFSAALHCLPPAGQTFQSP